jgi:hypothetical protein
MLTWWARSKAKGLAQTNPAAIEHEIATRTVRMNVLAWEFMRRFCEIL